MPTRGDRRSPSTTEPTVLVVDDEETPRSVTCRMVHGLGYQTHTARDGREALRHIQQHPGEVRLVLTDLIMPYMDGGELSERVRDLQPRLPIVLMSSRPVGVSRLRPSGFVGSFNGWLRPPVWQKCSLRSLGAAGPRSGGSAAPAASIRGEPFRNRIWSG